VSSFLADDEAEIAMFDISSALTHAGIGAAILTMTGFAIPGIPDGVVLLGISIAGSGAAVGFRAMAGHVPDRASRIMAFLSGILFANVAIPWINRHFDLQGLEVGVFVLLLSLIGARLVKFLATDFDVGEFVGGVLDRFSKK
jgi:uncharacterized membrane protein (Fun14 family)